MTVVTSGGLFTSVEQSEPVNPSPHSQLPEKIMHKSFKVEYCVGVHHSNKYNRIVKSSNRTGVDV